MFVLDLNNPTDPANYIDREFAAGTPFNWQDEVSGQLMQAVMAYLRQEPTPEQLRVNRLAGGGVDLFHSFYMRRCSRRRSLLDV